MLPEKLAWCAQSLDPSNPAGFPIKHTLAAHYHESAVYANMLLPSCLRTPRRIGAQMQLTKLFPQHHQWEVANCDEAEDVRRS